MAYFIAAYITKQRFTVLTKNGGGDHKRRLSRVHYICTMHCVQCTLEKQCTAHHVINERLKMVMSYAWNTGRDISKNGLTWSSWSNSRLPSYQCQSYPSQCTLYYDVITMATVSTILNLYEWNPLVTRSLDVLLDPNEQTVWQMIELQVLWDAMI